MKGRRRVEMSNRKAMRSLYRYLKAGYLMMPVATFYIGYALGRVSEDVKDAFDSLDKERKT